MINFPSIPRTFLDLLTLSIRYHFSVFRKTILLIIFLVMIKDAYIYFGGFPKNVFLYSFIGIIMGFMILYLVSALLYSVHCILKSENIDWKSALSDTISRMPRIIFAIIIFIVAPILLYFMAETIARSMVVGDIRLHPYAGLILVVVVGVPVMLAYLYYFYTIPLIAMENLGIWQAFLQSPKLIGREWANLLRVFGVYSFGVAMWLLISPDTLHGHLMKMYKFSAIYDFIVLSVTVPIFMNFIVLMRNDLKLRSEIQP